MSMECDTRLAMMSLRDRAVQPAPRRDSTGARRIGAGVFAALAAFALTLFTRTA
ncbi:hypothetical protein [uncultured Pseudodesulfovibrio sp.]|uniref:hypothetical protein n=1 Tax=uncultured Pseudodesulfovibrio sp. TaxID=2035858 RepID=UPI0029C8EDDD|nr:hypothetical protein [uncultured Pseudodesulfovibrio sp.]